MTHYTFDANNESWGTADFQWSGADGSPSLGCMATSGTIAPFNYKTSAISGLSIPVTMGDILTFKCKITGQPDSNSWSAALAITGAAGTCFMNAADMPFSGGSTNWFEVSGSVGGSGTVTTVTISIGNPIIGNQITQAFFDSVYVAESPPSTTPQTRYLGMDADNANMYISSIRGGTMTLQYFAIAAPGTLIDQFTGFGTCSYTAPDSYTRGIWPVVIGDLELYLYGRDGNNKQVQYNDINGTAGWVDEGPGTATWATTKFCVSLMPQPFAPLNQIAAFADDDIYQTLSQGTSLTSIWAKTGDAGTVLRTAGRVTTEFPKILVAGQGTAQTYYSQNYGVSFANAFSGLAGTVNAIEVSR